MGQTDARVDAYIVALPAWQQAICEKVRVIVHAAVWKQADFTRLFDSLNAAGLVIFNRKRPIVRVLAAVPSTRPRETAP